MKPPKNERRKYSRYDTGMELRFRVVFTLRTTVKFELLDQIEYPPKKYSGFSRNISAEGLCFVSKKKLKVGDILLLEIYVPQSHVPVLMEGRVCWCKRLAGPVKYKDKYTTGVKLSKVNGRAVAETIYYDQQYNLVWSIALEAVFSSFKDLVRRRKTRPLKTPVGGRPVNRDM